MGFMRRSLLPASSTYEGFVATRAQINEDINTTFKQIMTRTTHVAVGPITSLKLAVQCFKADLADAAVGGLSSCTAALEYPLGTIAGQFLFGGNATGTVGSDPGVLFSDYLTASVPDGGTFAIRKYTTSAGGVVYNNFQTTAAGEECRVAVSGLSDQTMSTSTLSGGTGQTWSSPPFAIIGPTTLPSVLVQGDSRTWRSGDSADGGRDDRDGVAGNIARSLGSVAFVKLALAGNTAQAQVSNSATRGALYPYGSHTIMALGINDLNGGRTVNQTISDIQTIMNACSAPKKYLCTIEPYTSSSDSWTTTGNQTNLSSLRVSFNDTIRAGVAGVTGYYEVADVVESARNSTFWKVSGGQITGDGLHENFNGYDLIRTSGVIPVPVR